MHKNLLIGLGIMAAGMLFLASSPAVLLIVGSLALLGALTSSSHASHFPPLHYSNHLYSNHAYPHRYAHTSGYVQTHHPRRGQSSNYYMSSPRHYAQKHSTVSTSHRSSNFHPTKNITHKTSTFYPRPR